MIIYTLVILMLETNSVNLKSYGNRSSRADFDSKQAKYVHKTSKIIILDVL